MRHQPLLVHRVAVEAAADLVTHPAARHPLERARGHAHGLRVPEAPVGAQQQRQARRGRKLGGAAEAAPALVEIARELRDGLADVLRAHGEARRGAGVLPEELRHFRRLRAQAGLVALPEFGDPLEQGPEAGASVTIGRREVGAGEERLLVRGQEHRHGPAPLALVHGQRGRHVDVVEVGPLLAVHLDGHEVLVHEARDRFVLEGLALHHVAPVAGGVSDAQQDRLVLGPGAGQGLLAPGMPVHRVVGVLEQVGAGGVNEAVRVRRSAFVHQNTLAQPT